MNKNLKQPKTVGGRHCRPNNLVMSFLRTMFFLAVMVIGTGSAWGDVSLGKVTIGSTITSNTSTEQNFGNNGVIAAAFISETLEIKNPAGYYAKISDKGKIKIRVNKGSVFPGDILKVNVGPSGNDSENLGYIVEGSNTFVEAGQKTAPDKYTMGQDIAYTLKASDIQNEDASYDFIQINRSGGGHAYAYHSVEIVRPEGTVIKWTSGEIPSGCDAWFTLGDDETHRKESISGIAAATVIHLRATDSDNNAKIIRNWTFGKGDGLWTNPASRDMDNWTDKVVDGVLNIQPHFADAYTVRAVKGDRCATVSVTGKHGSNSPVEINGIKQIVDLSKKYSLTFTATGESDYIFDGWYNGDNKISSDATYSYGEYTPLAGSILTYTAKYHPANRVNITVEPAELKPAINIYFHGHHDGCIHSAGDSWGSISNGANVGPGTSIDVSVADVTDYVFVGWYENETLKSTEQTDYAYENVNGGCNLIAKFAPAVSDGIVTFSSENNEMGTVTATVSASNINTGANVTGGSTVTFTATPSGSNVFWRWQEYSDGEWHDIVGATATYEKRIDGNFTIKAIFSEPKTFTASTPLSTYGNVKITKNGADQGTSYTSAPYPQSVKFVATPNAKYTFVAWYSSDTFAEDKKVSTNAEFDFSGTSGNTEIKNNGGTLYAKFVRTTGVTPVPTSDICQGGMNFNLSTLVANWGATLDGTTVTTGESGGSVSLYFAEPINLSEAHKWALKFGDGQEANLSNIAFRKNGVVVKDFWENPGGREVGDENKPSLASVDEIRLNFKNSTTTNIISFNFETRPDVKHKVPTLAAPTEQTMLLIQGETLKLRITDTNGYWREFNSDYSAEINTRIASNAYAPSYDIADLTAGDYYFRVIHGGNCKLGHYHTTAPVDVHVKVTDPVNTVEVNGTTRQYNVYAPEGITSSEPSKVGVVISLHGASNDYWNGRVDFNSIAETEKNVEGKKFVVVYPRGLMRQLRGQERGWETYTESNTEDVEFFKAIVTELKKTYTVDDKRIYLAGFSNGGMMAYKAAHQAADFFAAFASVGGYPVNESHLFHAGKQPTPFIHIQGKADGIFPNSTYPLDVITHNMVYRNGAKFNPWTEDTYETQDGGMVTSPKDGEGNDIIDKDCHAALPGGAAFYMYKVAGMGHTWTYDWDGDHVDDVAATMWKFFNKDGIKNSIDQTLKFRINDSGFWSQVSGLGFDNVNTGTSVLSYGGRSKTDNGTTEFNKDSNNKNMWHSLQFNGGINGAPHFLKLNVYTKEVTTEKPNQFFLVKLTKTGDTTPVFAKRYQAGRGKKDLYINFVALPGFNEYKLEITKSSSELVVEIHGMEFYSGRCEDKSQEENPTAFYDVATVLKGMNPIYQPVFDKSYAGIAKEFLPIADIPVGVIPVDDPKRPSDIPTSDYRVINDDLVGNAALTSLPSTVISSNGWTENDGRYTATITGNTLFNIAKSDKTGEDDGIKSKNAFIFDKNSEGYTIDRFKGLCISQHGRAEMPEYLNGTRGAFPDHGVIAIKLQGTLDFYLLAQNEVTYEGTDPTPARRTLKVYYTNDQLDGELKELKEWWFFGTRSEDGYNDKNGQSLAALSAGVRLPQLGKDGTCTVFITYEGREKGAGPFTHDAEDAYKIWIKGFVIKRPDLKVTIGRTDSKYSSQEYNGENNTKCTRFGENKPYVWSFENVGFNNTKKADITQKKINAKDGRTYVCGGTDDSDDHVLLYSDGASDKNEDKVQFDGRVAGQEHIEFLKASQYNIPEATDDRKIYDPIQSNGLKVNVTGSGWFKIQCAAPNGPVNMKVYTQPNYGSSYISLLREFRVEPVAQGDLKTGETTETAFREYTVYLKSRGIHDGNNGFWDGETADAGKEEIMRQSLFVVFDEVKADNGVDTYSYAEGHPQLNIHQLSWLNEEPADYVFQREEDPKLLTEWQEIKRNDKTVLYWKAGNDDDADYTVLKGHEKGSYNVINQINTDNASKGVKSPDGYASTSVPSDAGAYNAYWDIAAPARVNALVEKAYGNDQKQNDTQYAYNSGNNTEFDTPVSGSFIRISAMQNTYVVAHVIPGNTSVDANATPHSGATVYVLDETGNPIPSSSSDLNASRLGYIAAMVNGGTEQNGGGVASQDKTIRIDICANAGKEYFICAKDASISLARLEVHDWRYKPAKGETLALTDNKNNSTAIAAAYDAGKYYMDATLTRTFAAGKWASLVLPFSLNEQKFKEVFGENAKCIHFTDVDKEKNIVKLTHHYYNMIVAGRPVFIYTPKQVVNPQFKDITLQTKDVKNTTTESGFTFHASYDGTQMKWNDLYMNNANAIKYVSNDKSKQLTYPGMRSFIQSPNGYDPSDGRAGSVGAKAVFLSFLDDDYQDIPTGIEELISAEFGEDVVVVTKTTKIYDLLGNVMGEGSDINSLPAGIYIVNGKKYIVK